MIVASFIVKRRIANRRVEDQQIAELVQITLDALRNQELAHNMDPVTAPYPYLSSLQLRDYVLQNEHSIPARRRLWERVEWRLYQKCHVTESLAEAKLVW